MNEMELAASLFGKKRLETGARENATSTIYGTAVGDSADGKVSVVIDGDVSADMADGSTGDNVIEMATSPAVKSGDTVLITLTGTTAKKPMVTAVVRSGDRALDSAVVETLTEYATTLSPTSKPGDSDWSTDAPAFKEGEYVWMRQTMEYGSGRAEVGDPVVITGNTGAKGEGTPGKDGKAAYVHIAYANSADGKTDFDVSDPTGRSYLGTYTDDQEADSTDPSKYAWSKVKGEQGIQGIQGAKGDTGAKGEKGDTGAKGEKGDTGAKGEKGDTGAKGEKGDTGAKGAKGDTGAKGDDGVSPTVTTTQTSTGATITITDASGSHEATVSNGQDADIEAAEAATKAANDAASSASSAATSATNAAGKADTATTKANNAATSASNAAANATTAAGKADTAAGKADTATSNANAAASDASKAATSATSAAGTASSAATSANNAAAAASKVNATVSGTTLTVTDNTGKSTSVDTKGAKGDAGKGISSAAVTYRASTSGTVAPTGTWSSTVPTVTKGQYLWTKTVTAYTDGTTSTSYSVAYQPTNGVNGTSVTIKSTAVAYQAGASGTTVPTGSWSTSVPTVAKGQYLWTRTVVTYSPSGSTTSYAVAYQAKDGTNGTNGSSVTAVKMQYYLSTSNTTQTGGSWRDSVPNWTSGKYIWQRSVTTIKAASGATSTQTGTAVLYGAFNSLATSVNGNSSKITQTADALGLTFGASKATGTLINADSTGIEVGYSPDGTSFASTHTKMGTDAFSIHDKDHNELASFDSAGTHLLGGALDFAAHSEAIGEDTYNYGGIEGTSAIRSLNMTIGQTTTLPRQVARVSVKRGPSLAATDQPCAEMRASYNGGTTATVHEAYIEVYASSKTSMASLAGESVLVNGGNVYGEHVLFDNPDMPMSGAIALNQDCTQFKRLRVVCKDDSGRAFTTWCEAPAVGSTFVAEVTIAIASASRLGLKSKAFQITGARTINCYYTSWSGYQTGQWFSNTGWESGDFINIVKVIGYK